MSYDRDRRASTTSGAVNRDDPTLSPGKKTLTEALQAAPAQREPLVSDTQANEQRASKVDSGGGSMIAAAADTELAYDGVFTPALVKALQANPSMPIEDVLAMVAENPMKAYPKRQSLSNDEYLTHPTIVEYGQRMSAAGGAKDEGKDEKPAKAAVLIANQNYTGITRLQKPIAEARTVKDALATRGFDASIQPDKTAADMASLWGAMVSSAKPGDELVAMFSGHGALDGLVGVDFNWTTKPTDIVSTEQVAGLMSSATARGAYIRFIIDACHSGTSVDAVREVRQNELARLASSTSDALRVNAAEGLLRLKERLIAYFKQRDDGLWELDKAIKKHETAKPDAADAEQTATWSALLAKLKEARVVAAKEFDRKAGELWDEIVPMLEIVRSAENYAVAPPKLTDYRTLGAQINYIDELWNVVTQPMERAAATPDPKSPFP